MAYGYPFHKATSREIITVSVGRRNNNAVTAKGTSMQTRTRPHRSIAKRLSRAQAVITTTIGNPEIVALLGRYGYGMERLQEGKALYDTALRLHSAQKLGQSSQRKAGMVVSNAWNDAQAQYMVYLKLARIVLEDSPEISKALMLNGTRHRDLTSWIDQARMFYTNTLKSPNALVLLEQVNVTPAALEAGLAEIGALEGLRVTRVHETIDARSVKTTRDAALTELDQWISRFRVIARVAMADHPILRAKLLRA